MTANLRRLERLRLKLHRLDPSRPLRTTAAAAAFVRERRVVMVSGHSSLPVLTEAIVGRAIRRSWMADPQVHRMYRVLTGLHKFDFLEVPLVLGKEVLIEPSLGPAVERIAADSDRMAAARRTLTPLARRLLERVDADGQVRMDRWRAPATEARRARLLLSRLLLVTTRELHTEAGYHTTIVSPWATSRISQQFAAGAARLSLIEAKRVLLTAAVRSAVLAPLREVTRWFVFGIGPLPALVDEGGLRRVTVKREIWLTAPQ